MIRKYYFAGTTCVLLIISAILLGAFTQCASPNNSDKKEKEHNFTFKPTEKMQLPDPVTDGTMSLEKALTLRRSDRSYTEEPLTIEEISQLLWSAQGVTNERGFRTAPSAGATFPLEIFFVVNNVDELEQGIYQYYPDDHSIEQVRKGYFSDDLTRACLGQSMVRDGSVVFVFGAIFERTTNRYGERGIRYVHNEIGHASQNLHLQAAALGLGTVVIGAYNDDEAENILDLGPDINVLYIMPVGNMR